MISQILYCFRILSDIFLTIVNNVKLFRPLLAILFILIEIKTFLKCRVILRKLKLFLILSDLPNYWKTSKRKNKTTIQISLLKKSNILFRKDKNGNYSVFFNAANCQIMMVIHRGKPLPNKWISTFSYWFSGTLNSLCHSLHAKCITIERNL